MGKQFEDGRLTHLLVKWAMLGFLSWVKVGTHDGVDACYQHPEMERIVRVQVRDIALLIQMKRSW